MKSVLYLLASGIICWSCASSTAYQLSDYEKDAQKGYHANEANRLIDSNEKNKKANKKAAEKYKEEQNKHLNALNNNKAKKATANRTFKFY